MAATDATMPAHSMFQCVDGLLERLWFFQSVLVNGGSGSSCIDGSLQMAGSSPAAEGGVPDYSAVSDLAQDFHSQQHLMGSGGRHDDQLQQLALQADVVQQMRSYVTRAHQLYQSDRSDHDCSGGPEDFVMPHESFVADDQQHLQLALISVSWGAAGGGMFVDDQRLQRLRAVTYGDLIRVDAASPSSSSSSFSSYSSSSADHNDLDLENDDDEQDDRLARAFDVYDKNRDGFISASELAYVLRQLGLLCCTSHDRDDVQGFCKTLIQRVDTDGNGLVDIHEFKAMVMCA